MVQIHASAFRTHSNIFDSFNYTFELNSNICHKLIFPDPNSKQKYLFSIYFNMKRGEVKLAQLAYFLANQSRVSDEIQELKKHFVGHIICGDFNIWPKSPIYRFILERYLNMTLFDRYGLAHPVESERFLPLKAASNALNLMYPRSRVNLPLDHMKISANCEFGIPYAYSLSDNLFNLEKAKQI